MRIRVDLNGDITSQGTHMGVYFQLMKGEYDDCVVWPFDKQISLILIHQDSKKKCKEFSWNSDETHDGKSLVNYQKPKNDYNRPRGYPDFITLEKKIHCSFL